MLNQLIESKNHKSENARRGGFIFTTLGVLVAVLLSGWTYSLFAKNFRMGAGEFEFSNLVAPVEVAEVTPPKPEPKIEKTLAKTPDKTFSRETYRELYEEISSSKNPPKEMTGEKEIISAQRFDLSKAVRGDFNQVSGDASRRTGDGDEQNCGLCENSNPAKSEKSVEEKTPEVVVKQTPKPAPTKEIVRSIGVVNGKATFLAMPPYPIAARQIRAEGAVNVQVLIDEKGNVISASAVSGHPLLRAAAVNAARQSRFSPTLLSNQPVKVTGVIIYNFKPF